MFNFKMWISLTCTFEIKCLISGDLCFLCKFLLEVLKKNTYFFPIFLLKKHVFFLLFPPNALTYSIHLFLQYAFSRLIRMPNYSNGTKFIARKKKNMKILKTVAHNSVFISPNKDVKDFIAVFICALHFSCSFADSTIRAMSSESTYKRQDEIS